MFSIAKGVSPEDEMYVREGIRLAQDFLSQRLGATMHHQVIINARSVASRRDDRELGVAIAHSLVLYTGADGWLSSPPFLRVHVAVHELTHVMQADILGDRRDQVPLWLEEGIADYVGYQAVIQAGLVSAEDIDAFHAGNIIYGPALPELASMEAVAAFQSQPANVYDLAYLAVQDLVKGRSLRAIRRYYEQVAGGADWQTAFRSVFHQDVDAFYQAFEAQRTGIVPPDALPAAFAKVAPADFPADVAISSAPPQVARGAQMVLIAGSTAGVRCRLTVIDRSGTSLLDKPSFADGGGLLFWLWTVPSTAKPGQAEADVACDGTPAVVPLKIL